MPKGRGSGTVRGGRQYGRRKRDSGSESDTEYVPAYMRAGVKRTRKAAHLRSSNAKIVEGDRVEEDPEARRVANIDMYMETEENDHDEDAEWEPKASANADDELEEGEIVDDDEEENYAKPQPRIRLIHDIPLPVAPFPGFTEVSPYGESETAGRLDNYSIVPMEVDSSQLSNKESPIAWSHIEDNIGQNEGSVSPLLRNESEINNAKQYIFCGAMTKSQMERRAGSEPSEMTIVEPAKLSLQRRLSEKPQTTEVQPTQDLSEGTAPNTENNPPVVEETVDPPPSPPRYIQRVRWIPGMSKAPHFPQQPVARQNEDGSLELECYVDANPKPEIKWFYDNKEVKQDGRFSLKLDNRGSDQYSAILTIKDLADSDAGAYRCAIVNPHGKGNANFNLKLTGFSSPTFVEKPQISSRDDGQVMVMEFRAKSILKPVFVWSKGDEIVSPSDRIQVVLREEPNQVFYSALEIKDPTKEKDAGQFVCTAKNDSGKLTATFTVKFEVPQGAPTFTRKPQILQKTSDSGDPAIVFDIGYQADRNPEVIWINPKGKKMKESSRIKFTTSSDGGSNTYTATLELKNYKAKDSGTYTCNIKNDAGEANVELTLNIEGPMDDGADDNSDA